MIAQDNYHRMAKSSLFEERSKLRREKDTNKINAAMLPLIGMNQESNKLHEALVGIGSLLNTAIWSYSGIFEEIHPRLGNNFDSQYHILDNEDKDHNDLGILNALVAMTVVPGMKYKLSGKEWRVCVRATVVLLTPVILGDPRRAEKFE